MGLVLLLVVVVATAAGCPMEASNERSVVYSIDTGYVGREQELVLSEADARALALPSGRVSSDSGTFVLRTPMRIDGDIGPTYCFQDPLVIVDAATGEEDEVLPAGTCVDEPGP